MNAVNNSISQENGFVNSENLSTPVGQARNYAKILKMGENGTRGLVNLSENLPDGVDLGEAALAFNAIYNQGKSGKAFSAALQAQLADAEITVKNEKVSGVYALKDIPESNVILYDDILTTGSTIRACVHLLNGKNIVCVIGIDNNS